MHKLETLTEYEGFDDPVEMMEAYAFDSLVPAICMAPDCDYTTHYEPDQDAGHCEECLTNTVTSCLILGGVI